MNQVSERLQIFKEEILNELRESENKTKKKLKFEFERELDTKLDLINQNLGDINYRLESIQDFNRLVKVKVLDNIGDILSFKVDANEDLFSKGLKIACLQEDLTILTNKYDKMCLDNLLIPGKIGDDYCKYKNLKEYLETSMKNLEALNIFREESSSEIKHYKDNLDKSLKSINYKFEVNEENTRESSNKTLKLCELMYQDDLKQLHQKIDDVKLENGKYHLEVIKKTKELKESLTEAEKMKEDFRDFCQKELLNLKYYHGDKIEIEDKCLVRLGQEILRLDQEILTICENYKVTFNYCDIL